MFSIAFLPCVFFLQHLSGKCNNLFLFSMVKYFYAAGPNLIPIVFVVVFFSLFHIFGLKLKKDDINI